MAKTTAEFRCLLICPSDVGAERDALGEVVVQWNALIGEGLGARIQLIHDAPDASATPRQILKFIDDLTLCDFGVAVFWTHLGTPHADYFSGSIEQLRKRGVPVIVYFNTGPLEPEMLLLREMARKLREFKAKLLADGVAWEYNGREHNSIANLCEQATVHLTNVVTRLLTRQRSQQ
jgi:hypothetical protein